MATRATKAGSAYDTEKKIIKKYDENEELGGPARIVEWINKIITESQCNGSSCEDIHAYLKDGVVLCKLINKLNESTGGKKVPFKAKAMQTFVAAGNVENFSKGCQAYGLAVEALFQSTDLWEGRKAQMLNVVNCLSSLGFLANSKGFSPEYIAPKAPTFDD